ncbi:hypothetical protein [Pseudomonas putida]
MNADQKRAAGELLGIAGAVLLFCCVVPIAYLLVVEMVSRAYSVTTIAHMFFGSPVMLPWWAVLFGGMLCFRVRRKLIGPRRP